MKYKWCFSCMNYVLVEGKGVMQCTCGGNLIFNTSNEEDVERYYDLIGWD